MWHGSMPVSSFNYFFVIFYSIFRFPRIIFSWTTSCCWRLEMVNRRPDSPLLINMAINLLQKHCLFIFSLCALYKKYWPAFYRYSRYLFTRNLSILTNGVWRGMIRLCVMCCIGLEFDPRPWLFSLFSGLFFSFFLYMLPLAEQYRQALNKSTPLHLQQKQRSFLTFGFGASGSSAGGSSTGTERSSLAIAGGAGVPPRRESNINVNVTPTSHDAVPDTPEIRKYKKRFNSEVLCASLWGKFFSFSS